MKVKFRSQATSSRILSRAWKMDQKEEYKKIRIRGDISEEERAKLSELYKEAMEKEQFANRSDEDILLEDKGTEIEIMVHIREGGRKNSLKGRETRGWKVTYINTNEIISTLTELNDYLR